MEREDIPPDVLRFIVDRIDSVAHLEALLLIFEGDVRPWTEVEVAARLYVAPERARIVLQDLVRQGLITATQSPDSYEYDPAGVNVQIVRRVAASYRRHLIYMASVIHSKVSSAVREFARAFQFKEKE